MNVLITGSGAREHTTAWKLRQSTKLDDLFVVAGNTGDAGLATNVHVRWNNTEGVVRMFKENRVAPVLVGNEERARDVREYALSALHRSGCSSRHGCRSR